MHVIQMYWSGLEHSSTNGWINDAKGAGTAMGSKQGEEQAMWAVWELALLAEVLVKGKLSYQQTGVSLFLNLLNLVSLSYSSDRHILHAMNINIKCQQQNLQESHHLF